MAAAISAPKKVKSPERIFLIGPNQYDTTNPDHALRNIYFLIIPVGEEYTEGGQRHRRIINPPEFRHQLFVWLYNNQRENGVIRYIDNNIKDIYVNIYKIIGKLKKDTPLSSGETKFYMQIYNNSNPEQFSYAFQMLHQFIEEKGVGSLIEAMKARYRGYEDLMRTVVQESRGALPTGRIRPRSLFKKGGGGKKKTKKKRRRKKNSKNKRGRRKKSKKNRRKKKKSRRKRI